MSGTKVGALGDPVGAGERDRRGTICRFQIILSPLSCLSLGLVLSTPWLERRQDSETHDSTHKQRNAGGYTRFR